MGWSADQRETVKRLVGEGQSAAKIAAALGRTRNAVIGVIHRMQHAGAMPKRDRPRRILKIEPRQSAVKPIVERKPKVSIPPRIARSPIDRREVRAMDSLRGQAAKVIVVPMPFSRAVDEGRCLFFAADPFSPAGADMLVCGCLRAQRLGKPYCATHLACEGLG